MGQWPVIVKLSVFLGESLLVIILGYRLIVQDTIAKFEHLKTQQIQLKADFKKKQYHLLNLIEHHQQDHVKQDLEAFSLDTLKFVGILRQSNEIWGLIELPDSQIMRVRMGDYIGQNDGHVRMIKNDFIQLEETIKNRSGMWEKHITTLDLNTEK